MSLFSLMFKLLFLPDGILFLEMVGIHSPLIVETVLSFCEHACRDKVVDFHWNAPVVFL